MNANDYLALNFKDIKDYSDLYPQSRRDFLKRLGGGIIVCVVMSEFLAAQAQEARRFRGFGRGLPSDFNAFLRIGEDGRVTGYTGKIEMGQGPITSLPQMLAEELDTPLDTVDIVMGDTDLCPWDMGTFGSMTTRMFGPALQAAAAEAKAVLLELAAEALKVPQAQLAAKDGAIFDKENPEHRVTYGQLTKGKKIERHIEGKPPLKDPAQFTIVGKPELHRDGRAKVTGAAHYAGDIRLPGMLYAKILRPPAHDAKLKSVDTAPAQKIPGVQVVQTDDLIAVLHEFPDVAEDALGQIKAEFDVPEAKVDDKTIFDYLLSVAPPANVLTSGGDLEAGRKLAVKTVETTYLDGLRRPCGHGNPHGAGPDRRREGHGLGFDAESVWRPGRNCPGPRTPGGKSPGHHAVCRRRVRRQDLQPAGRGSGAVGENYRQTRAGDVEPRRGILLRHISTGSHCQDQLRRGCVREDGLLGLRCLLRRRPRRATVLHRSESPHFRTWPRLAGIGASVSHRRLARPGNNTNTFARESHIDQMAAAAGMDPVEFRLNNLSDAE